MDPIKLIKQDHRTVRTLFRKFEKASRKSERQKLGEEIIEELSVHTAIEEQLMYPTLRKLDKRMEGQTLNALEEHHAVKMVLAELDKMDAGDERYAAKIHVVRESVELHIEEEEAKLLPRLERLLDRQQADAMVEGIRLMKTSAPTHPHPLAPDEPPGNVLATMLAKVSDAGKDLVRRFTDREKAEGHRRVARRAKATAASMAPRRATTH